MGITNNQKNMPIYLLYPHRLTMVIFQTVIILDNSDNMKSGRKRIKDDLEQRIKKLNSNLESDFKIKWIYFIYIYIL